jgi:hypothetical protein
LNGFDRIDKSGQFFKIVAHNGSLNLKLTPVISLC